MKTCECVRHKKRTEAEKKDLLVRLKKAEGQIRGIEKMIEDDLYCPDILIQVSAVTSALNSFNKQLLAAHIKGCVAEDIKAGKEKLMQSAQQLFAKVYEQAQAAQGAAGQNAQQAGYGDDVVDGEYKEV